MKTEKVADLKTVDLRVWCEHCCVRIAPNEERAEAGKKTYHTRCLPKASPKLKSKAAV
jgi:hypothetical protein